MKNITRVILSLFLTIFFYHTTFAQNDNGVIDAPGDIAILSYHSDNGSTDEEDGLTFLLIDDAPAGTTIRFIDEEWNGTTFVTPTGEGDLLWENNTGATIAAGTVVTIFDADGSLETASIGTVDEIDAGFNFGTAEDFVAITGTRAAPGTFLTAVDGNDGVPFISAGTGLSPSQILSFTGEGRYTGITECNGTAADCLAQVYDTASNWTFGDYPHVGIVVDDFLGSLFFVCGAPTAQTTATVFGAETSSTLTLDSFTAPTGGADGYAIYINDSNSFIAPADGDEPTANTNWNNSGQQAVYFGTSNSPNITISGLNPGTTYFFQIYAYNDCAGTETYENVGLNATDTTSAALVTITGLTGDNKTYDGTTTASVSGTATLSGVAAGDDVSLSGSPVFTFATANVGTGITITTTGYTLTGADAGNYTLEQPTLSADITTASLTITGLTGNDKIYDGTDTATATGTASLSGVVSGDDVVLGGAPAFAFVITNVGTGITINSSGFTISGADASNYDLTQPTLSADITPASLTVVGLTGGNKVYDGTTAATASGTATLSGVIGSDDVVLGGTPVYTFASANVGTGITINSSGFTISGADASNYNLTQPTLSADITPASLTVVGLTGDNKVYDGTTAATASGTTALSGVIGSDDVVLGGAPVYTFASANVGTGITINSTGFTISGTDASNYTLSSQPMLSADITTASLTVVGLTGDNKAFDGTTTATASGTATLSGVIGADDVVLGGTPVFTFASSNAGTGITINTSGYTISGVDSGNYSLTQPTLSADITGINLTITGLTGDNKVYDGTTTATASGTASLSGVIPGDDVVLGGAPIFTFASEDVGTGISISATGYTISGADAGNYSLTQPSLSADITPVDLTVIGLTGDDKAFDGTTTATASGTASLSGVIGADDVVLGGTPVFTFASPNVGVGITINTTGFTISGADSSNYTLTQPILSASIIGESLVIDNITTTSESCDGAGDGSATVTVSGGAVPYSYEWSTGDTTSTNTLSNLDDGNYSVTVTDALNNSTTQSFTIAQGTSLDITVSDNTTVYLGYPPASQAQIGVVQVSNGQAPYTYLWSTGETTQNISVSPSQTTTYTVTVTDAGGCSATANIIVTVIDVRCGHNGHQNKVKVCHKGKKTLCIAWQAVSAHLAHGDTLGECNSNNKQVKITNLKVYPNPFKHHLSVNFNSSTNANVDLIVFNHRGNRVLQKNIVLNNGNTEVRLNLARLKRGVYYLKIVIDGKVKKAKRIIKH